jgi:hypothetical protein
LQLGSLTKQAKTMDKQRQNRHAQYMKKARRDPLRYSKVVHVPALTVKAGPKLVGRKVEVAFNIQQEGIESYYHIFEGTITEYYQEAYTVVGFKTRSKKPLALVKWDPEFNSEDSYIVLDASLYSSERTQHGWALLGSGFTRYCDELRAQAQ